MTELIWDGKYKDGKKVSPVRIALPFQTIETVNEKRKAGLQTDMFAAAASQYQVVVKVIDILGNNTTKLIVVEI